MITYKKETLCDLMRMWLEGKSSHGVLQTLRNKYDASYYNALYHNPINVTLENQAAVRQQNGSKLINNAKIFNIMIVSSDAIVR